ncbi:MAG TPA: hypothetical protein VNA04_14065 [Thermoanaerobaculia bacterium]|nr:hypothetical protein [Thermoanaerobaculia bacterium]
MAKKILARCPWCGRVFGLTAGGYSSMRSLLGGHMMKCDKRPPEVKDPDVVEELDRIMAAMEGEES